MSRRESKSDRMNCLLEGSEAINNALSEARTFGEAQQLSEDDLARFCIIIEELIANLYDHGGLTEEDKVGLTLSREPDGIRIIIADPGKPFDPRSAAPRRERPERGGGAGIDIIRAWAQVVDYAVNRDGNRLELKLPI